MKRYIALWVLLALCLASANVWGEEEVLRLPADKILRISQTMVEFEHHGWLPISADVKVFQYWEDEVTAIPLEAVKVGFEEVSACLFQGEVVRFDVYDPLYIRTMRVAISTDKFMSIEHGEISFSPTSKLYVEEKGTGRGFQADSGEEVRIFVRSGRLHAVDGQGTAWEFDQRLHVFADA